MWVRVRVVAVLIAAASTAACAQVSQGAQSPPPRSTVPAASAGPPSVSLTPMPSASPATAGSASATPSSPVPTASAPQAISWIDQPAPKLVPPDFDPDITHPALYRPCTSVDVKVRANGWGAGMGTMAEFIYLTNISATPCTLAGSATAVLGIAGAHEHTFPLSPGGLGHPPDAVANLKPGQTGWMQITQGEECATDPNGPGFLRVGLELPGGGVVVMVTKRDTAPQAGCELGITPFGTTHVTPPEPTYPTDPIKASITAPTSVRAGTGFDYTVTLTNPTSKPISLTPCPSYEETAFRKPDPHPDDQTYQLNCDGHRELAPHDSLSFAMHTAGIGPRGQGQILWRLQQSNTIASDWDITVS